MPLQKARAILELIPRCNPSNHIMRPTNRSQIKTWGHSSATKFGYWNSFCIPPSWERDGSNTSPKILTWSRDPSWAAAVTTIIKWTRDRLTMAKIPFVPPMRFLVNSARGATIMGSHKNWGAKVSSDTPASMISWGDESCSCSWELIAFWVFVVLVDHGDDWGVKSPQTCFESSRKNSSNGSSSSWCCNGVDLFWCDAPMFLLLTQLLLFVRLKQLIRSIIYIQFWSGLSRGCAAMDCVPF